MRRREVERKKGVDKWVMDRIESREGERERSDNKRGEKLENKGPAIDGGEEVRGEEQKRSRG